MINILGMNFADDNYPDVGSICIDKDDGNLLLLSEDMHKLNDILTRAVCIGTYGVGVFPFKMGDTAFVIDLLKMFVYDSKNDCWLDVEELVGYLLLAQNAQANKKELETTALPFTFTADGKRLYNYRIYGNTVDGESVGDLVTEGEHSGEYLVPVTVKGKNLFDCKIERIPSLATNITSMSVNETLQTISITANNTDARIGRVLEVGANYADNLGYKYPCEAGKYYYLSDSNDVFDKNYITFFNDDNISLGYSLFATTAIQAPNNATYFTIRFGIANSVSGQTYIGKLMITELSTFEPPSIYEPYQPPVTTNLYLPEQIKMVGDEAEYVDYREQKQYFADGTSTAVTLPALPTLSGTNTLSVGTTVQPSKIWIQGNISEIETVSVQALQANMQSLQPLSFDDEDLEIDVMPTDNDLQLDVKPIEKPVLNLNNVSEIENAEIERGVESAE